LSPVEHRTTLLERFSKDFGKKYDDGQERYGTLLWEHSISNLVENAWEENLDHVSYVGSIRLKIPRLREELRLLDDKIDKLGLDDRTQTSLKGDIQSLLELVG
jgi:hypothetical protein